MELQVEMSYLICAGGDIDGNIAIRVIRLMSGTTRRCCEMDEDDLLIVQLLVHHEIRRNPWFSIT